MNEDTVLMAYFMLKLAQSFKERLALNISGSTANLDDSYFCFRSILIMIKTAFDLVGNVWDNLNSVAAKITASFFVQDTPVNFTGSNIGLLI